MTRTHVHTGRIWLLSAHEEIALKQMWAILLKYFGYEITKTLNEITNGTGIVSSVVTHNSRGSAASSFLYSKEGTSLSSGNSSFVAQSSATNIRSVYYSLETGGYGEDGEDVFSLYHLEQHSVLNKFVPEDIHRGLWGCAKNSSADNWLLRFLRVTNYDVKSALKWLGEVMDWRINVSEIDELVNNGDAGIFYEGKHKKLVDTLKLNEVYMRGTAKSGSPIVHVRVKDHIRGACPDREFEQYVSLVFEWSALSLSEYKRGIDQTHVLFDMTNFTLSNADFHAVKYTVRLFQKMYPDSVEKIYVHDAPRIFSVMWKIIVKWLKPHLKEKLIFTKGKEMLKKYIEPQHIPKHLGGKDTFKPSYIEPTQYNSLRQEPDALFSNLLKQRDELTVNFIEATIKWIEAPTVEESKRYLDQKIRLGKARAQNYVFLDPYLRSRGLWDRNGEMSALSF